MAVTIVMTGVFLSIFALVGVIIFVSHKREQARTQQFRSVADDLGLQFHPQGDPQVHRQIDQLRLFNRGHGRKTRNLLCGKTRDVQVAIFGYRFTTGGGKNQQTHQQTVISFQSPHLALPAFELRPENVFHKIGQAFGYKDIDFDSHPTFSSRHLLRGPDEAAVRDFFTPEVLEFFESRQGISVEAAHHQLIYYRASKRIQPQEVRSFMEEGFRVYGLFKRDEG